MSSDDRRQTTDDTCDAGPDTPSGSTGQGGSGRGAGPNVEATRPLVRLERHGDEGHVAEIVLDRPEAMNAVSSDLAIALARTCAQVAALAEAGDVRAVVVSSTHPKAFCVGADLKERNALSDAELVAQRPTARAAYRSVLDLPVPAVAAVDGYALGGGCEIALSCDLIVAAPGATFALPEVSVGVVPGGGGTQLVTRRLGWGGAASLVFTARRVDGTQAVRMGLADELAPDGARAHALELAAGIARHSPVALRNAKRAMRLGADVDLAAGLEIEDNAWRATAFSGDRAEGVAAFVEKRSPRWPGR
ncbi:enoyl-CoA hydratase/isomerase family protein [Agilicoccus flavus]|uniref:enoyl-CoA hydratase/isomerase family protein n=1 Tax=Agilicoccus flavus TaxID=2775968 RepID=UPI001CF6E9A8|nr:enoyl-CoA hydratase-related protein [Agilicoccus flavus]